MLPYINREIKTPFRWYRSALKRNRNLSRCKCDTDCAPDLLFPLGTCLPFQINVALSTMPSSWLLKDTSGNTVADLFDYISFLTVYTYGVPADRYVLILEPQVGMVELVEGTYEMEIEAGGVTYYSETFKVSCHEADCLHELSWRNCGDLGTVSYVDPGGTAPDDVNLFRNYLYFDPALDAVDIGEPTPVLRLETETNAEGGDLQVKGRKDVDWKFKHKGLPWFILDALTEAQLCDDVRLILATEDGGDALTNVRVEFSWEQDPCRPQTVVTFQVDEATSKTGCCDTFEACPDLGVNASLIPLCDEEAGTFTAAVMVLSPLPAGFTLGDITWTYGETTGTEANPSTDIAYNFGPFTSGGDLVVSIENRDNPDCPLVLRSITGCVPWYCDQPGMFSVEIGNGLSGTIEIQTTTGYFTRRINGVNYTEGNGNPATLQTSEALDDGEYCVWSSDENGNAEGSITYINDATFGGILSIDPTRLSSLVRLESNDGYSLTSPVDITQCAALEELILQSYPYTSIDLSGNPALTTLNMPSSALTTIDISANPLLENVLLGACAITDATVIDALFNALDSTIANGTVEVQGGTNAAPTAASLAARNALTANGWTISTN